MRTFLIPVVTCILGLAQPLTSIAQLINPDQGVGRRSFEPAPTSTPSPDVGSITPSITNRSSGNEFIQQPPPQPLPQRLPPDPKDRIEFQDFILQSTGRDLPIFGAELFRQSPSTFAPVDNIPVTPDYVIGPGDQIIVRAWGQVNVDYSAYVDRNGAITIPKIGAINVAGVKYSALGDHLKTAFGRVFRNFELTATLGRLRSIQIFVVGQARRPGTYTVSSLSTLVTALFAIGGPSSKGSMRSIQLKRGSQVVAELDLYDFIATGDKSKDAALLPGDVIYIPPVGQLVAINGSINVPAIYEIKPGATIFDLVRWAGGLATTAQGQRASLERIEGRMSRSVESIPLDAGGLARNLRDGDLVTVFSLPPRFSNVVTLRGNVVQPGRFPFREGMRVRDLIPDKDALISRDYWQKRNQIVGVDEDVARLLRQQELHGTQISLRELLARQAREEDAAKDKSVAGIIKEEAAATPGPQKEESSVGESIRQRQVNQDATKLAYPARAVEPEQRQREELVRRREQESTRLINQIRPSPKEINWEYAVIERVRTEDLTTSLVPFHLGRAVLESDPRHNIPLQAGDIITVFSKEDIQVPTGKQSRFIRLEGEFLAPGVYQAQPGETLRQLVTRAGGIAPGAYLFGADFTRESTRVQQQRNLEESLNRLERDLERSVSNRSQNVVAAEDAAGIQAATISQKNLIARLRQLRASGRIALEMPEDAKLGNLPDIALEDGDRFFVPPQPAMVSVFGAVYSESSFLYKPQKRTADYLAQAGGATKDADRDSVYVLRADGSVVSRRQSGFLLGDLDNVRIMPGDSIVVPEDFAKVSWMRLLKDYAQIFYQFGLGAAALKVLKN